MTSALLVIDAQKTYTDPDSEQFCADSKATVRRINSLIDRFQEAGDEIVLVRHVHKADGSDLGRMYDYAGPAEDFGMKEGSEEVEFDDKLHVPDAAVRINKTRYSAFSRTDLDETLRKMGVDRVAICGFMTNFCCESTARDAHSRDYFVDFIVDATGTPGTENLSEKKIRSIVAELLGEGFAQVYSTKEYLTELSS